MDIIKLSYNPSHNGFAWFGCIQVAYALCKMHKALYEEEK